ncbi:uncharacterized protein LOC109504568 isoform X2 [Harpegnathos saltator]|uniref:uncharacterized protein LOC109504568 isoform X2 n=1 Tax=Harpegnathos saltator TaxID=610380 RepID=UPI0009488A24|nr:uncharacterized protein LOC109504568 isoform X2 [Harpegnathos saltator]
MDFKNVNPLNVRLNAISGNILPMAVGNELFPATWRMYGALVWLLQLVQLAALFLGMMHVPAEKALIDSTTTIAVSAELFFIIARIHMYRHLVVRLIDKLNDILGADDDIMKNIVQGTLRPTSRPLKFYWATAVFAIVFWNGTAIAVVFKKNVFTYEDYSMPVAFSRQPFSTSTFLMGSLVVLIGTVYNCTKKVSVDVYMIHLVLLMTAQYRYIAIKLAEIFRGGNLERDDEFCCKMNHWARREMRMLCRRHNAVVQMMFMLKKLLSLIFSLIYVNSVFRFCFIAVMFSTIPSQTVLIGFLILVYTSGAMVQLYTLCSRVQQLLDASTTLTDEAFHEDWYRFGPSIKRSFMFLIMANNMECKLATFGKFNLSLPSLMTVR